MKLKIKTGDTVEIISGSDKGKKGSVLMVNKSNLKIKVSGVMMQTCYDKQEGMQKREGFVDYSNVKFVSVAAAKTKKKKAAATKSK